MKNNKLLKTNLLISVILLIGFALTAIFSYRANYQASLDSIEQVCSLTAEGIYYQLTTRFTKPVNISLTMAHDSFLVEHLEKELEHLEDDDYIETTKGYLDAYRKKYGFDSVFLVSCASGRYYNFNGLDRVLTRGNQENDWYFDLLDSNDEYSLNVDNDEVYGADNEITVFVNCKVTNTSGTVLGIVGMGIRIDHLKELLKEYEDRYHLEASLIDEDGMIEISTTYTGYEKQNWFTTYGQEAIRRQILTWNREDANLELWTSASPQKEERSYVVTRYIPELSWNLIVEQNTGRLIQEMHNQLRLTCMILASVILTVLIVITSVIRNFNRQITSLLEERQATFLRATERLYDTIYELNITKNCCANKRTEEYFESLGAKGMPYSQALRVVSEKQIKPEYRQGYISTFDPDNIIREYEAGNDHLQYDFMILQNGTHYHWMRIDAYIFYSAEDDSIHMFTYRKNIDEQKQKELQAATDEMTGFFTKKTTERLISRLLEENPDTKYAFFIFDIDNFKQANDRFGHAFGDFCIRKCTGIIKEHFHEENILGRIGGDEFAAFIPIPSLEWARQKAKELTLALNTVCQAGEASWDMSVSIGGAVAPQDGSTFEALYKNADIALYQTKQAGKKGYTMR